MEHWLCVAEKPDAAKKIATILSNNSQRSTQGPSRFNWNYSFKTKVRNGQEVMMIVTSITGHLYNYDFPQEYGWGCDPTLLFETSTPVHKIVGQGGEDVEKNLHMNARNANKLVLWLDCDREGENISFEVIDACRKVNPRLSIEHGSILRARFSDFTPNAITRAIQNLERPRKAESDAVDARQELDLRIGAAFTRFQTKLLSKRFTQIPDLVSYGPCQFPTLGFVVERYLRVQNFTRENFWSIDMQHEGARFTWSRGHLFDQEACFVIYELCLDNPTARVTNVSKQQKRKWKPLPLNTVELQKLAARKLGYGAQDIMTMAEGLYNKGFISYPRTETDSFSLPDDDLKALLNNLRGDGTFGPFVQRLVDQGAYERPKAGKHNDNAHPPIHPVKLPEGPLSDREKRLYELICRHFIACCWKDAIGFETVATVDLAGEIFTCKGMAIAEHNFLEVYVYEKWTDTTIPNFVNNQTFVPQSLQMTSGSTQPPPLLSESDLIARMDQNGIGTDATIATHIQTIQERKYVEKVGNAFKPTELGLALVESYDTMGFELSKPNMRAKMEADMNDICRGQKTRDGVVQTGLEMYKAVFLKVRQKTEIMLECVGRYFPDKGTTNSAQVINPNFSRCGTCGNSLKMCKEGSSRFLRCDNCNSCLDLPRKGTISSVNHNCPICNFQALQVAKEDNKSYNICPHCFNNPPAEIEDAAASQSFYCHQCSRQDCSFAKRKGFGGFVRKCPSCGLDMELKCVKNNTMYLIGCKGSSQQAAGQKCENCVFFKNVKTVKVSQQQCQQCGSKKVDLSFEPGTFGVALPGETEQVDTVCCFCEPNRFNDIEVISFKGNFSTRQQDRQWQQQGGQQYRPAPFRPPAQAGRGTAAPQQRFPATGPGTTGRGYQHQQQGAQGRPMPGRGRGYG